MTKEELCLVYSEGNHGLGKPDKLFLKKCDNKDANQRWSFTENGLIAHRATGFCIELNKDHSKLSMQMCDVENAYQIWAWKKRVKRVGDGEIN